MWPGALSVSSSGKRPGLSLKCGAQLGGLLVGVTLWMKVKALSNKGY